MEILTIFWISFVKFQQEITRRGFRISYVQLMTFKNSKKKINDKNRILIFNILKENFEYKN